MRNRNGHIYLLLILPVFIFFQYCLTGCVSSTNPKKKSEAIDGDIILGSDGKAVEINDKYGTRWKVVDYGRPALEKAINPTIYLNKESYADNPSRINVVSQLPELVDQVGHTGDISCSVLSPNEKFIVTGTRYRKTILIWDTESRKKLRTIPVAHNDDIHSIAISPDNKYILSGGSDSTIKLWDVKTGQLAWSHRIEPYITKGSNEYLPAEFRALIREHKVLAVAFNPKGDLIAFAGKNFNPRIYDYKNDKIVSLLQLHDYDHVSLEIENLRFSPDGSKIATIGKELRVWDVQTGKLLKVLCSPKKDNESFVYASPLCFDGKWQKVAYGIKYGETGHVIVQDISSGSRRPLVEVPKDRLGYIVINEVAFSPDGESLVAALSEDTRVYDAATGELMYILDSGKDTIVHRTGLSFSRNGEYLFEAREKDLLQWDLGIKNLVSGYNSKNGSIVKIGINQSENYLYSVARITDEESPSAGRIWDLKMGGVRRSGPPLRENLLAWDMDKSANFLIMRNDKNIFDLVDVASGKTIKRTHMNPDQIKRYIFAGLSIDKTGKFAAVDGGHSTIGYKLVLWDTEKEIPIKTLWERGGDGWLLDGYKFSPDGSLFAASSNKKISIWSNEGAHIRDVPISHGIRANAIAFSPDNIRLATIQSGIDIKLIKIWNIESGALEHQFFDRAEDGLKIIAFSNDSKRIAFSSSDYSILVYEMGKNTLTKVPAHSDQIYDIHFSKDDSMLFSCSFDGTIAILDINRKKLLAKLISDEVTNDWIVATPEGLFDGSPGAWNQLSWRFNNNTFDTAPVELFFNEYYYPGLLVEILAGRHPTAPTNIAEVDRRQPEVEVSLGTKRIAGRKTKVRIKVSEAPANEKIPTGSGAKDVRLFRNGTLVKAWRGNVLKGKKQTILEHEVTLLAGENRLQAYAFNGANIKSRDAVLKVTGSDKLKRLSKLILVAMGVDRYDNPGFNLRYAVADATAMVQEVGRQQKKVGHFDKIQTVTLLNNEATKRNFLALLNRLAGKKVKGGKKIKGVPAANPEDVVMIYFAGHGTTAGDRFYMLPHDLGYRGKVEALDKAVMAEITKRSVSDRELEAVLEQVDAGQILLFIDACNSGQALEASEKRRGPMNAKGLAQLAYEKGMNIVTAAQGFQLANENTALGHGFLTYALVEEGLKTPKADTAPNNGEVTVREWIDFAAARVPEIHEGFMKNATRAIQLSVKEAKQQEKVDWVLQQPRVFYRREAGAEGFIVAKP